ncbi:hypothetical protein os1_29180 [Comamonadaceae bacterium OS-1]|nr:hypothetical protein os1_29180 [Comamonadaceae bacterium OS-1]
MTSIDRRQFTTSLVASAAALAWPSLGHAEEPIAILKILFGYPPGGVSELVTRGIGMKMTPGYAKVAIVDTKPGAAGRLVMESVKSVPADGSVVLVTPSSVVSMYPHVYSKLHYDPFTDITPVSTICEFVHALAVGPGVPESVKSLADLVAWFKANPDKASVANPGEGSLPHFLTMLLSKATGVKIEAIGYAGGPPGVKDTVGGQVPAMIANEAQFINLYREGKLRLLATSGAQRSPFSPNVPTFAEQGIRNIQVSEWIGMFVPAKTPAAVTARISMAVRAALEQPDLVESFGKYAIRPVSSTPEELGKRLRADYEYWASTIKSTGFTPLS